jgi:hypothetical protein
MKYKHVKGLQLQKPNNLKVSNAKILELLENKEVELNNKEVAEFESLGVQVKPLNEKPKIKKVKKEE